MDKEHYKKLSVEIPIDEYVLLKTTCARKRVSIKDFVNQSLMRSIEEFEDEEDVKALQAITEEERQKAIPWEEAKKLLGWDKL